MSTPYIITPKSKIQEILDAYPELEEKLFSYAPSFKTLISSTIKHSLAKATTLQQIAANYNLNISNLVSELRREVGFEESFAETAENSEDTSAKPAWLTEDKKITVLDVREMLKRGEHPVNQVMEDLKVLPVGSVYEIIAPFLPVPLIEKATSLGFTYWSNQIENDLFEIYFYQN